MRHSSKGMHMQRKILTAKPKVTSPLTLEPTIQIIAGRTPLKGAKTSSALFNQLNELVCAKRKTFIQMRHGAGYCGTPIELKDGWLTMAQVSIHGTKQKASAAVILIQIKDGSFIAHLHPADANLMETPE